MNFNSRFLMCRPDFYALEYEINAWMSKHRGVSWKIAARQWQDLHHLVIRLGGYVEYVEPERGLPDMVFTANAGLVRDGKVAVSFFRHSERSGEERHFKAFFEDVGYKLLDVSLPFEGAGDALFENDILFAGYGFRTDKDAYKPIQEFFKLDRVAYVRLIDPYFYHLDTCFCPLGNGWAMYYPGAFSEAAQRTIEANLETIMVEQEEAMKFACNSVVIDDQAIMPGGCPKVAEQLNQLLGFTVHSLPMGEYIKSGGAAKCCVLELNGSPSNSSCS